MLYLWDFFENDVSSTAIEYALIGALIFLVIVAGVTALGQKALNIFTEIANKT